MNNHTIIIVCVCVIAFMTEVTAYEIAKVWSTVELAKLDCVTDSHSVQ